ncbi:MAG: hypothetical protein SFW09_23985 [Hyphomicrobiaceae bacterium]|nr:hypothetical protein [Hyphomicrobiaceae bacterium]
MSEAFHVGRGHRSIVVIACQHPGEDGAERVARDMAERLQQVPLPGATIDIVPLVNGEGRLIGLTRETPSGIDLNRCWHIAPSDIRLSRLRQGLAVADFVIDIHADEHADRPYTVAPAPCPVAVQARVVAFREAFAAHLAHATRRPRPIGAGEDDPGILVNWLAKCGVPAVMLEVPMQLARARHSADFQSVRHRERRLAVAAIAGLEAVLKADGVDREAPI